ncbi:DUF6268 family outer membrane beta-barrel protein [Bacteroides sp.]|uniref:DUF6268 family outer membrane beta-barrel protein n=1 Tax=Bacteroides sp. TaxID=29523 RepID=UPI0025BCE61C|nr:DUF6268 family outer membrane beta-barrel protein [Bacteroides sp.]
MKKVLFLLFIVFNCSGVNAQIMFKTEYFGASAYRMMEGETDKKVGDSKGSAVVYQGGINIPLSIKLNENNRPTMWAVSLGGAYAKLENKNFTEPLVIDEILNLGLSLSHLRPLTNKWSMLIAIGGGIYMPCTKLSQIRYKNILGNIGTIFIYHLKPNLELGGGIAMNNSFGYPMIFPAIYFKWTTEGRFGVKIAMLEGIEMSAGYTINNNLNLNLVVEMNGQMALLEQNGKDKIFTHQYFVAGLRPEIKLGKHISIPITAGIHAMRPAEMVNRSLKSMFQDKGYYFQVSPYVSAGLQIGF